MSRLIAGLATGLALLGSAVPTAVALAQDPVAKEIMRLEDAWAMSEAKKDGAAVGKLLAETFLGIGADGAVQTKAQRLKAMTEDKAVVVSEANSDYKVNVYGGTAVITGVANVVQKGASGNTTVRYRWLDVWIKQADGKWLCVAEQSFIVK